MKLTKKDRLQLALNFLSMIDPDDLKSAVFSNDYFDCRHRIEHALNNIDIHHIRVHASIFALGQIVFGDLLGDTLTSIIQNEYKWNYLRLSIDIPQYAS